MHLYEISRLSDTKSYGRVRLYEISRLNDTKIYG